MEEIREYHFGDDVRDIDWRVTARKEKPYTKIYMEEKDREIFVWLDLSKIMMFGSVYELKSVTAAKIAALLGWVAINNGDRFGCVIFDGKQSLVFRPKNDRAYLMAMLKKIANISKEALQNSVVSEEARQKSLKMMQGAVKNKAGLFVISSLGYWGKEDLNELAVVCRKSDVYVMNVFDRLEEKAPKAGQYMAEYEGEKLLLDSSLKGYRRNYDSYFAQKKNEIKQFCQKNACKLVDFSVDMGFVRGIKIY